VIAVAYAVVDERAVVIKTLNTLVAIVAVPGLLGTQVLALNAHVVEVKGLIEHSFKDLDKVFSRRDVAWVDQTKDVEND
jgi:hypothetical protein